MMPVSITGSVCLGRTKRITCVQIQLKKGRQAIKCAVFSDKQAAALRIRAPELSWPFRSTRHHQQHLHCWRQVPRKLKASIIVWRPCPDGGPPETLEAIQHHSGSVGGGLLSVCDYEQYKYGPGGSWDPLPFGRSSMQSFARWNSVTQWISPQPQGPQQDGCWWAESWTLCC